MANKLIISSAYRASIELTETVNTQAYSKYVMDKNVGAGGTNLETTYDDGSAIEYTGTVNVTSATALASISGLTGVGTAPAAAKVKMFYVKCDSFSQGASDHGSFVVDVYYDSTKHASLDEGESVVIPFTAGTLSNCKLASPNYNASPDRSAIVTATLIGDS